MTMPTPYSTAGEFNQDTLPQALRNRHNTKAGVWGLLRVLKGEVTLVFEDPPRAIRVTPEDPCELPPQAWHHVEVTGEMRMQVEFYREKPLGEAG
jgi:hemoglobin